VSIHTPVASGGRGIPRWALGLTVAMLLAGSGYFATNLEGANPPILATPAPSGPPSAQAIIARAGCQACHGSDLAGLAIFPSLHGVKNGPVSANLAQLATDHPDDWANIWIAGTDPSASDPAMRSGMPAFGGEPYKLSAEEIATVVAYLKTLP
jgi:mono/diheme cytochrome c family protein